MGILGLTSYIDLDQSNYVDYALHNTRLVIDAENFASFCYSSGQLAQNYGGEYLEFSDLIEQFLDRLHLCNVEPLFIFGGCHDRKGLKTKRLISRAQKSLVNLQTFTANLKIMDLDNPNLNCNISPRLMRSVLLEVLRKHEIYYLACEDEADRNVAELALYLKCPLASGDSDFFLYRSPNSQPYCFLPFKYFQTQCQRNSTPCLQCRSNSTIECWSLPCKRFRLDGPSLGALSPWMLSLFAIFTGDDNVSDVKLPHSVTSTYFAERLSYSHRRIRSIIQWLKTFKCDSKEPLSLVLELYDPNERVEVEKWLKAGLQEYELNPERLSTELESMWGLDEQSKCKPAHESHNHSSFDHYKSTSGYPRRRSHSDDRIRKSETRRQRQSSPSSPLRHPSRSSSQSRSTQAELSRMKLEHEHIEPIFHRWPANLVSLFQKLFIVPSLIEPLYIENGVVVRVNLEDLCIPDSVNLCAKQICDLHLGTVLEMELELRCSNKLFGIKNSEFIEYRRSSPETIHPFPVRVEPITLPHARSAPSSFLEFFKIFLNLNLEPGTESRELQGLACLMTLWLRHTGYHEPGIRESPLGLSMLCCVLTTPYNLQSSSLSHNSNHQLLIQHYAYVISLAKSSQYRTTLTIGMIMKILHQLSELQNMAYYFSSLIWLVDCLTQYNANRSNKHYKFSPNHFITLHETHILFPSCKLLFWLSQALELATRPRDRFEAVRDYWIPNLLMSSEPRNRYVNVITRVQEQFCNLVKLVDKYLGS